ncbi:uncharacterized protein EAE97_003697 [Botrytis byssoidea]|uniref:Uncharacterized protein n=1 Tax=Botrytis byssoidea TaxID=139641 RepID=A0A9P5M188_9HELO|nr:uncharacterized protein EAE97_003697 [Botrytis byssoidea]KAF7948286.1 hypothetical protein EAE97_003697 [Botrytis byssoidea]
MSYGSNNVGGSLSRSNPPTERQFPRGSESTSPFDNGEPDEDCEPRRRLALYHLGRYHQVRERSHLKDDEATAYKQETGLDTPANSESLRRQRAEHNATSDLLQSELAMLRDALERTTSKARSNASRGDIGFLLSVLITGIGAGFNLKSSSFIMEILYVACAATGLHGAYRTIYWAASRQCCANVRVVQDSLEKSTLRRDRSRYLEGASWSILRNLNL